MNTGSGSILQDDLVFYFMDEKGEIIRTIKDDYLKIEFLDAGEGKRILLEIPTQQNQSLHSQINQHDFVKNQTTFESNKGMVSKYSQTINHFQRNNKKNVQITCRRLTISDDLIYTGTRQVLLGQTFQAMPIRAVPHGHFLVDSLVHMGSSGSGMFVMVFPVSWV